MPAVLYDEEHVIIKNLKAAFENSPMCMILAKTPAGQIIYANDAAQSFLEQKLEDMLHIDNSNYDESWKVINNSGERVSSEQFPLSRSMKSGEIVSNEAFNVSINQKSQKWSLANASPIYDENQRIIASMVLWMDITEQKNVEHDLRQKANFDHLTGIFSRQKIVELAERKLQRTVMNDATQCFILIDVDNFKDVNDAYGHPIGDDVLTKFVELISNNIRPDDLFGRYGGEEFLVILNNDSPLNCVEFAEKLRVLVQETPIETDAGKINLTLSASVISIDSSSEMPFKHMIKRLDSRLYDAKREGRNRVYKVA